MKKTPFIGKLLFCIILLISCEKQRGTFTRVKGKVLEYGSGIPVENALVKFVQLRHSTFNVIETILDTIRSGPNGSYSFTLNTDADDYELLVYVEADNFFSHNIHAQDIEDPDPNILRGVNQYLDIEIIPYSWVRITAINSSGNGYAWINRVMGSKSVFGFEIWEGIEKTRRIFGNYRVDINSFLLKNNIITEKTPYFIQTTAKDKSEVIILYSEPKKPISKFPNHFTPLPTKV